MAPSLASEIDLVVFIRREAGGPVADEAVELLPEVEYRELEGRTGRGVVTAGGPSITQTPI